jgi:hypothetical protein
MIGTFGLIELSVLQLLDQAVQPSLYALFQEAAAYLLDCRFVGAAMRQKDLEGRFQT